MTFFPETQVHFPTMRCWYAVSIHANVYLSFVQLKTWSISLGRIIAQVWSILDKTAPLLAEVTRLQCYFCGKKNNVFLESPSFY